MKIFYGKVFKNYFLMMCCLFLSELMFKIINGISLFNWSVIRIFIGINIISLLLSIVYSFFGRIGSNVLTGITTFVFTAYAILETGFYKFLGTFMSFGNISQLDAVVDGVGDYLGSFRWYYWLLLLPFFAVCAFYTYVEHKIYVMQMNELIDFSDKFDSSERKDSNNRKRKSERKSSLAAEKLGALIIACLLVGFYYSTFNIPFMQNDYQLKSSKELLINPDFPNIATSQLGYVAYSLSDIKSTYFSKSYSVTSSYSEGYSVASQKDSEYKRDIDDTIWKKMIDDEKNSSYKTLSNYYISQNITDMNDYTALFYNKNLIVIYAESLSDIGLNPSYFPNLYKLYSEGWSWDNSYSSKSSCATGNNELASLTSLYTVNDSCTFNTYANNVYPESLFNLFNNSGYTTSSYHNYTEQYYKRNTVHTNLGSNNYYGVQDLSIPYSEVYAEWPSDVELMKKVLKNTEKEEKFMSFITTSSTSMPYGVSSQLGDLYLDTFNNTNYSIQLKRYMSKLKVLDEAIGVLLDGLEEQDKLDDTVIVLYSDHTPYSLSMKDLKNYYGKDISKYNESDKTPFIIYNSKLSGTKYSEYTSSINLTPTVANLFALDYDPRLYAGHDILSKDYDNRVIFADGSWIDEVAFYDATSSKITYFNSNTKYTKDEALNINNTVKEKIIMSNLAIRTNYFSYYKTRSSEYKVSPISGEAELVENTES